MARGFPARTAAGALLALVVIPGALAQERIGVSGAVNPAATGAPPGLPERTLVIGNDVVYNERIATTANGQAQLLFLDKSALSVGPNSDIVIDEFVYDPNAGTGRLVANATKGVFRFVGGALSKQDGGAVIKVGATTIGVRGGMIGLTVDPGGAVQVLKYYGDVVKVTTPGGSREIYRNDYYVAVDGRGVFGQGRPVPVPAEVRLAMTQPLTPLPGTTGGGTQQPTELTIQQSGYPSSNSKNVSEARADANSRQTIPVPTALNPTNLASLNDVRTVQQIAAVGRIPSTPTSSPVVLPPVFAPVGGTGLIRAQLVWTVGSDLDLHLILPGGAGEVFFGNTSITFNNGQALAKLDHDNTGPIIDAAPNKRIENIAVTGTAVPAGSYSFSVFNFSDRNGGSTPFTLTATGNGGATTQTISGTLPNRQTSATLAVTSAGGSAPATGGGLTLSGAAVVVRAAPVTAAIARPTVLR